jgi:hypothetical protein
LTKKCQHREIEFFNTIGRKPPFEAIGQHG